jgi:dTDP-4-amino-4,6-dideoxygalactose transaminase
LFISGDAGLSLFSWLKKGEGIQGGKHCLLFSHARGALLYFLNKLKCVKRGSEILLPDYICDELVSAIKSAGFDVTYYFVQEDLKPDTDDVIKKTSNKTLAVLVVHYFGFFSSPVNILRHCNQNDISVIDDCAHVLFYDHNTASRVFKGDAAIFSLKKQYPVPDGGLLLTRDMRTAPESFERYPATRMTLGKFLTKHILSSVTSSPARRYGAETYYDKSFDGVRNISSLSENILKRHVDADSIIKTRRDNFYYYVNVLRRLGTTNRIEILYSELSDFEVPYMFPVKVNGDNEVLIGTLRREGIPAISWPTLPAEVRESGQYKAAQELRKRIVLLPLHQDIGRDHIDHIVKKFKNAIWS